MIELRTNSISFGETIINYSINRTKRKSVGIIVQPDGNVLIRAPIGLEEEKIKEAILKKRKWIIDKINLTKSVKKPIPLKHELVSGEKILLKNRLIRLKIHIDNQKRTRLVFAFRIIRIYIYEKLSSDDRVKEIEKILINWYKEKSFKIITKRIERYTRFFEIKPKEIKIRDQKKRWGSCNPEGILIFNWRLVMAPVSVIDYIIVHELCHLIDPSHSSKFWELLNSLIPNYKKWKEWLRINGPSLDLRL